MERERQVAAAVLSAREAEARQAEAELARARDLAQQAQQQAADKAEAVSKRVAQLEVWQRDPYDGSAPVPFELFVCALFYD